MHFIGPHRELPHGIALHWCDSRSRLEIHSRSTSSDSKCSAATYVGATRYNKNRFLQQAAEHVFIIQLGLSDD